MFWVHFDDGALFILPLLCCNILHFWDLRQSDMVMDVLFQTHIVS